MVDQVLTADAVDFLTRLQREFGARREQLLAARQERAQRLRDGELPDFLPETANVREGDWRVAPVPAELFPRTCDCCCAANCRCA
jgi:malate synthase